MNDYIDIDDLIDMQTMDDTIIDDYLDDYLDDGIGEFVNVENTQVIRILSWFSKFTNSSNMTYFFDDWFQDGHFNYSEYNEDVNEFNSNLHAASDVDVGGVLTSAIFNFFVFIALMLTYEVLRRAFPNVYASRKTREAKLESLARERANQPDEDDTETGTTSTGSNSNTVLSSWRKRRNSKKANASDTLPDIFASEMPMEWIRPVFGVSWRQVRDAGGLDAYFFLRYIRMCVKITSVSALWGIILLFPLYACGQNGAQGWYHVSMANISQGSPIIWASVIFLYFFSAFVLFVMKNEYKHFVELRMDFLGKGDGSTDPQHHYSLMVESIPKELRSDTALFDYFQKLFPGKVHSANVILKVPRLESLSTKKVMITRRLEKAVAYHASTNKRLTHVTGRGRIMMCGVELNPVNFWWDPKDIVNLDSYYRGNEKQLCKGLMVDSIDYYTRELNYANTKMYMLQREVKDLADDGNRSVTGNGWFTALSYFAEMFMDDDDDDDYSSLDDSDFFINFNSTDTEDDDDDDSLSVFKIHSRRSKRAKWYYDNDRLANITSSEDDDDDDDDEYPTSRVSSKQKMKHWYHSNIRKKFMESVDDSSNDSSKRAALINSSRSANRSDNNATTNNDHYSPVSLPNLRVSPRASSSFSSQTSLQASSPISSQTSLQASTRASSPVSQRVLSPVSPQTSLPVSPRVSSPVSSDTSIPSNSRVSSILSAPRYGYVDEGKEGEKKGMKKKWLDEKKQVSKVWLAEGEKGGKKRTSLSLSSERNEKNRSFKTVTFGKKNDSIDYKSSKGIPLISGDQVSRDGILRMSDQTETETIESGKGSFLPPNSFTAKKASKVAGRLGLDFGGYLLKLFSRRLQSRQDEEVTNVMSSTGFVTFFDLSTVTCVAGAVLTHKPNTLKVKVAPEPRDIIWQNCSRRADVNERRESNANLLLMIGALLWSIPLATIQALASADMVAQIPGMEWLTENNNGTITVLINAYLPVVCLLAIIMILPYIFYSIAIGYEKRKTTSEVDKSVVSRYFYYQLANIYISVTAGSLWISASQIIQSPSAGLEILGNSLPTVVGYFISLLVTKILGGLPLVILRPGALSRYLMLRLIHRTKFLSQRELDEVYRVEPLYYGWEYPTQLLVIVICFTYAIISPIILIFGAVYFSAALMVYKKQVLYVYTPSYESGAELFPHICSRTIIGLICGQLTFMGYSIVRGGHFSQVVAVIPLITLTIYIERYFETHFANPSKSLTLELSKEIDAKITDRAAARRRQKNQTNSVKSQNNSVAESSFFADSIEIPQDSFAKNYYKQPILTESFGEPLFYRIEKQDSMTIQVKEKLKNRLHMWEPGRDSVEQRPPPDDTIYFTPIV